jgi:hypothetical protein
MAKVQGAKEKLHWPIYDSLFVEPKELAKPDKNKTMFTDFVTTDSQVIRFFVDPQNKTKLETNLQGSGVLPSSSAFEVRALWVVLSNLPLTEKKQISTRRPGTKNTKDREAQLNESEILADLIYNSVTSLTVGEKIMIEMPTFWFSFGVGISPGFPTIANGEPYTTAIYRLAEPIYIEPQQNFRVEMAFPRGVPGAGPPLDKTKLAGAEGPLRIWVVLDGYLTRDVQ